MSSLFALSRHAQVARSQPATAPQPGLRARTQGRVHPITRFALLYAGKPDALDFKFLLDQRIQIRSRDKCVAPGG